MLRAVSRGFTNGDGMLYLPCVELQASSNWRLPTRILAIDGMISCTAACRWTILDSCEGKKLTTGSRLRTDRRSKIHVLGWLCKGEGEARDCPVAGEVELRDAHRLEGRWRAHCGADLSLLVDK